VLFGQCYGGPDSLRGTTHKMKILMLQNLRIIVAGRMLNRSISLDDLRVPPGNRLEKLHAERKGQYSIRINDQYRICFEWRDHDAHNVEIVDYY
jgi:plasmid maintenance system killer protein